MGKIKCLVCDREFYQITTSHLNTHDMTLDEYKSLYPDAITVSDAVHDARSASVKGANNPFCGKEHTDESRQLIKDNHSTLCGEDHPLYGIPQTEEHRQHWRESQPDTSGINNPNYGKTTPYNIRVKQSCSHRGINIVDFDGFANENSVENRCKTLDYKNWRESVFERDGYKCVWCGGKGYVEAHHIKSVRKYPELIYDHENGITLCTECHRSVYAHEDEWEDIFTVMIN